MLDFLKNEIEKIKQEGLYKIERLIGSPQSSQVQVDPNRTVLNFCANNYLGLANDPALVKAGQSALEHYGLGMASVRFICGTQTIHKELEERISRFLGTEDAILYSSCFDANGGLFEALLGPEDAVVSDALNHASIIDGIRLCKAKRYRYHNNDMNDLESQLKAARVAGARFLLVATDGVFSMDGTLAKLKEVCNLADQYDALVMVDDSHAVGFIGEQGRGTPEYCDVIDRVAILTGTFGKALGGASGGYVAARRPVIEWLRNRSRPYLFSNTLAPMIAAVALQVLDILTSDRGKQLRQTLKANTAYFRDRIEKLGFHVVPGDHPIIPIMLGNAQLAAEMAERLLAEKIYVIGFSYPVVPVNQARIRLQISAAHSPSQLEQAIVAFGKVGKSLNII